MEASSGMAKTSTTSGGEVRRIHIIYFLSHLGRTEHPHLIRLHHFNRNGVYLRDVKRWLVDLRGKDMPEAFSWSYKRRYKNGYVWQDLLDDDLITPISDNEYVLKGSDVFAPAADHFVDGTYGGKDAAALSNCSKNKSQVDDHAVEIKPQDDDHEHQRPSPTQLKLGNQITSSRKTSLSEISQESPMFSSEISTATDDSIKEEEEEEDGDGASKRNSHDDHQQQNDSKGGKHRLSSSSLYSNLLGKKKEYYSGFPRMECSPNSLSSSSLSSSTSQPTFAKSKSYSSGTSKMLRNLITCGNIDTNDAALIPQKHSNKPADQVCKREALGRSHGVFGTPWNQQQQLQHNTRKSCDEVRGSKKQQSRVFDTNPPKVVSPAYKTVVAPICSQCGKSFRPEKLHSHMKSCKGLKALTKASATCVNKAPSPSHVSVHSPSKNGYFLTN